MTCAGDRTRATLAGWRLRYIAPVASRIWIPGKEHAHDRIGQRCRLFFGKRQLHGGEQYRRATIQDCRIQFNRVFACEKLIGRRILGWQEMMVERNAILAHPQSAADFQVFGFAVHPEVKGIGPVAALHP